MTLANSCVIRGGVEELPFHRYYLSSNVCWDAPYLGNWLLFTFASPDSYV